MFQTGGEVQQFQIGILKKYYFSCLESTLYVVNTQYAFVIQEDFCRS